MWCNIKISPPEHKGDVESKNEECEVESNQDELYSEIPEDKGDVEMTDDQCEVEMREDKCDDQMTNEGHVGPVVNTNGNKLPPPPSYTDVLAFKQKLLESSSVLDLSMNAHKSSSQGKQNSQVSNLVDYSE